MRCNGAGGVILTYRESRTVNVSSALIQRRLQSGMVDGDFDADTWDYDSSYDALAVVHGA